MSRFLTRVCWLLFITLTIATLTVQPTAADSAATSINTLNWWDDERHFRVPIILTAATSLIDKVVSVNVQFPHLLQTMGEWRTFDPASLHLIEVTEAGAQLANNLPFQLNTQDGQLYFLVPGNTSSDQTRYFHVYFDVLAARVTPKIVTPQVSVEQDVVDEEQASWRISTQGGTYDYHLAGAGFSSLVDAEGNDWIDYHPTGGSFGDFRGVPNLVFPDKHFHPGATSAISTLTTEGPLVSTVTATTSDDAWEVIYTFFPTYVDIEVMKMAQPYWFLYEGTPGGTLDLDADRIVYSDGVEITAGQGRNEDISGDEEWAYFADPNNGRSLFLINHMPDTIADTYWPLDGVMTVFGFGREQTSLEPMLDSPRRFSMGLVDTTEPAEVINYISSTKNLIDVTLGQPSQRHKTSLPLIIKPKPIRLQLFIQ